MVCKIILPTLEEHPNFVLIWDNLREQYITMHLKFRCKTVKSMQYNNCV